MANNPREPSPPSLAFPSTSEVGSRSNPATKRNTNTNEEKWLNILQIQQKNFTEILNSVKPKDNKIDLPEFDPGKENDVRAWIITSEMCMSSQPLTGAPLINALTRAMKNEASSWFTQIVHPELNWNEFKILFSLRYDNQETLSAFLINLNKSKPREGECIAAYATTTANSLINRWKNCSIEEVAVATTLSHISQFEPRIQRLAFTEEIKSRSKLQTELKAIAFLKRKNPEGQSEKNFTDTKRLKDTSSSQNIKCFYCGKLGHKSTECRTKKRDNENYTRRNTWQGEGSSKATTSTSVITCFKCQEKGHYASQCHEKKKKPVYGNNNKPNNEKRVDICDVKSPSGIL